MLVTLTCAHCGKRFDVFPSAAKRGRKYCSYACHVAARQVLDKDKFWSNVDKTGDCWEWVGGCSGAGYGRFCYAGKAVEAHRLSWEMHFGSIPKGKFVCHHCDNRGCVRPDHLFLGESRDNMRDMHVKARGRAKLSPAEVIEIRKAHQARVPLAELAALYGVGYQQICNIGTGKCWGYLPDSPPPLAPR